MPPRPVRDRHKRLVSAGRRVRPVVGTDGARQHVSRNPYYPARTDTRHDDGAGWYRGSLRGQPRGHASRRSYCRGCIAPPTTLLSDRRTGFPPTQETPAMHTHTRPRYRTGQRGESDE
ncbi:hypothetical protein LC1Hm_1999 [Halomicrobium sp. LC1Hm]|nr:hypothetical protein LC1Hm_1999 [Halomicrobium sp. LC1Hm]